MIPDDLAAAKLQFEVIAAIEARYGGRAQAYHDGCCWWLEFPNWRVEIDAWLGGTDPETQQILATDVVICRIVILFGRDTCYSPSENRTVPTWAVEWRIHVGVDDDVEWWKFPPVDAIDVAL